MERRKFPYQYHQFPSPKKRKSLVLEKGALEAGADRNENAKRVTTTMQLIQRNGHVYRGVQT
jgi:hypothetical protein